MEKNYISPTQEQIENWQKQYSKSKKTEVSKNYRECEFCDKELNWTGEYHTYATTRTKNGKKETENYYACGKCGEKINHKEIKQAQCCGGFQRKWESESCPCQKKHSNLNIPVGLADSMVPQHIRNLESQATAQRIEFSIKQMQNMEISSPSVEICIICKFPKEPKCFCFTGNVSVEMPKSHQLSAIGQAYAYHRDGNTASLLDVPQKQQDLHAKKFQAQQDSRLESHQEQPPKKYYSN